MHYIYLLKSNKANWIYIGSCLNLEKRLLQHNQGKVRSTKSRKPYQLIHHEIYNNKTDALKREIELKKNSSKKEELYKQLKLK